MQCTPIYERLISIRLAAHPRNIAILQIYAPTAECNDEEIEPFYEAIERHMASIHKKDILIVSR